MFLAIRDIRFAKGRFALMGGVVALITLLLVMLSGLTAGLGNQSTSAIAALPVDQLVFGAPAGSNPEASFTESEVTGAQVAGWAGRDGVSTAEPLGISQGRLQALGAGNIPGGTANVAVFGTGAGSVVLTANGSLALLHSLKAARADVGVAGAGGLCALPAWTYPATPAAVSAGRAAAGEDDRLAPAVAGRRISVPIRLPARRSQPNPGARSGWPETTSHDKSPTQQAVNNVPIVPR